MKTRVRRARASECTDENKPFDGKLFQYDPRPLVTHRTADVDGVEPSEHPTAHSKNLVKYYQSEAI